MRRLDGGNILRGMASSTLPDRCLNCREPLRGRFCHRCGQRASDLNQPLSQLLRELFSTIFAFDTRLWRTLRPLLFKPGLLTVDYNAGRRARYVPPLTLYVFISFVMFVTLAMTGYSAVNVNERPNEVSEAPAEDASQPNEEGPDAETASTEESLEDQEDESSEDEDDENGAVGLFLARFFEAYEQNPERFDAAFRDDLARAVFLLVPVFALLLKVVYLKSGMLYVQHLILSFHVHSFAFLVLTVSTLLQTMLGSRSEALKPFVAVALVVYLFIALRRVYGGGRLWTGVKLGVLMAIYTVVLVTVMLATLVVTVMLF